MSKEAFDKTIRIPVVTDLVISGDPKLKCKVTDKTKDNERGVLGDQEAFELKLKQKIEELKDTIGQDEQRGNMAREYAIRTEQNNHRA
ncbi:MAG TPA: hypothetical protein ENK78_03210 [Thiothrix sp.]|nr:hypothetical protein [Thiothrix sp.]